MWRLWTWKDIAGFLLVILLIGGAFYVAAFVPHRKTNWGFGPEWDCVNVSPDSDPICIKKPGERPHRSN